MVWVVLERSEYIGTTDLWDEGVMAAHYEKGNRPRWFETDDGHLKANLKRGPAMSLTNRYDNMYLYDDFRGPDGDGPPGQGGGGPPGQGGDEDDDSDDDSGSPGRGPGGGGPPGQQSVDDAGGDETDETDDDGE